MSGLGYSSMVECLSKHGALSSIPMHPMTTKSPDGSPQCITYTCEADRNKTPVEKGVYRRSVGTAFSYFGNRIERL